MESKKTIVLFSLDNSSFKSVLSKFELLYMLQLPQVTRDILAILRPDSQIPILRTMIHRLEVISFSDNCCQVKLNTDSAQLNLILFRLVKFQELMPGSFTPVSSQCGGGLQLNRDYEVNSEYGGNLPNVLA